MKINEIRQKAKAIGINYGNKTKKTELIHSIQKAEGNTPCFGKSNNGKCQYTNCCFMGDCLKIQL